MLYGNTQILYLDTVRYRDFTEVYRMYTSGEVIARILRKKKNYLYILDIKYIHMVDQCKHSPE